MVITVNDIPPELRTSIISIINKHIITTHSYFVTLADFRFMYPSIRAELVHTVFEYFKWQATDVVVSLEPIDYYTLYKDRTGVYL